LCRYLTPTKLDLLKFSLSLRSMSPKIEMFQQVAIDRGVNKLGCPAVIEYHGKLSCTLPDVGELDDSTSKVMQDFFPKNNFIKLTVYFLGFPNFFG